MTVGWDMLRGRLRQGQTKIAMGFKPIAIDESGCHAELVEALAGKGLRSPFDRLRVTILFYLATHLLSAGVASINIPPSNNIDLAVLLALIVMVICC